ncbi:OmpH family outer membrane protein [Sphingobacterium corticis]|uniref:OmpH family outer membrane protein n=2 Tax=Sphingobacterium corticis TaxID=1812823 RepID=A0ABW5NKZ9_9SPHI
MKNVWKGVVVAAGLLVATQVSNAQQKIGHINSQELMQATPEFKNAQTQIQTLRETKDKEYQGMVELYQKKQTEANEKAMNRSEANKATLDTEIQGLVAEMRQMEERIQTTGNQAQEELQKKYQELMSPIETKVMTAINAVAKDKGYAYILDLASGSLLYFEGGEDLTAAVKTKLGI